MRATLREIPDDALVGRAEPLAEVYRSAFGASDDAVQQWSTVIWRRHLGRDGIRLIEATVDGALVGFAYGYTGQRGQFWSDWIARDAPQLADEWIGGHFELVEIAVDPEFQGNHIGGQLLDTLVDELTHERAMLTTTGDEAGHAVRLYTSRGWQRLATVGAADVYGLKLRATR